MKRALSYIALLLFVLIGAQLSAYAQDGPDNEQPIYDDKVYHESPVGDMETETDNKVLTPISKPSASRGDSSAVKISTPVQRTPGKMNQEASKEKPNPQQAQSGDDSILSFNFIYYIIQRFKLQDIIE
jgi:hypothetical protein